MPSFSVEHRPSVLPLYEELELHPIEQKYPFLRRHWLDALEQSGIVSSENGWKPHHLVVLRSQKPIAFLPGYIKTHSMGEFVFDHAIAEFSEQRLRSPYYPKLIIAVPFTPATGPRILCDGRVDALEKKAVVEHLTDYAPRLVQELGVSSIHFLFPQADEVELLRDAGWAIRSGVQFQFHNPSLSSFDDFLGTFSAKRRAQIRRERRCMAERRDIEFEILTGPALTQVSPDLLYQLYLTTVDKYVWGRRYLNASFFRRIVETMPDALHVVLARQTGTIGDDGVIALAFNLLGTDALYGRYWGTHAEVPFLHFETCLYRGVEQTIQRRLSRFEPGAGGEHKHGRGFTPTLTQSAHFFADGRLDGPVRDYFERESEALKAQLDPRNA